jgi:hypothetical protein
MLILMQGFIFIITIILLVLLGLLLIKQRSLSVERIPIRSWRSRE